MKFDEAIKLLMENYIYRANTYNYGIGATKDIKGPQTSDITGYGDLGYKTNFDNVHDFFSAQLYNKAVGRNPANREVDRYVKILRTKTLNELKPMLADLNKQCKKLCKDYKDIEIGKGTTCCTLVDQMADQIGCEPEKWKNFMQYIEARDMK